jgi:hypothetical protein
MVIIRQYASLPPELPLKKHCSPGSIVTSHSKKVQHSDSVVLLLASRSIPYLDGLTLYINLSFDTVVLSVPKPASRAIDGS